MAGRRVDRANSAARWRNAGHRAGAYQVARTLPRCSRSSGRLLREVLGRFAMVRRALVGGGDADQHRLAERTAEKVDADFFSTGWKAEEIRRAIAARPAALVIIAYIASLSGSALWL